MSAPQSTAEVVDWATGLIRDARIEWGRPLARYGTAAWVAMPPRQRWAAVLLAAECWRSEGEPGVIASKLADEISVGSSQFESLLDFALDAKLREDERYVANIEAHRKSWRYLRGRGAPTEWRDDIDESRDGAA